MADTVRSDIEYGPDKAQKEGFFLHGMEQSRINSLTLQFSDPILEKAFLSDYAISILPRVRLSLVLGFFLYAVFGFLDDLVIPEIRPFSWFIRYAVVCPFLVAVFVSTYFSWFLKIMQTAIAASVFVAGMGIILIIGAVASPAKHIYYGGLILISMFAFMLSGLRFVNATAISVVIALAYLSISIFNEKIYSISHINNLFVYISSILIGMLSSYLFERHIRRNFLQRQFIAKIADELKHEVSERNRVLGEMEESKDKYKALMENAGDAILISDASGRVIEANRQAAELFGYPEEELQAMQLADLHPDNESRKIAECLENLGIIKKYGISHSWAVGRDGRNIPVDIAASIVSYGTTEAAIFIYRNITPYLRMEETLREYQENLERIISERTAVLRTTVDELRTEIIVRMSAEETLRRNKIFLNSIFDSIMDSIAVLDTDLNLIMVNKTLERWFSHKMPIRFKEKKCHEVFHDRKEKCEPCVAETAMRTGAAQMTVQPGADRKGRRIVREIYAFPFRDDSGGIVGAIEYGRDVTARTEAEESAARGHHLAQLGQLSAGIAHEINNPNNVIMCNSQLLEDVWNDAERVLLKYYSEHGDFLLAGRDFSEASGTVAETIRNITGCSRRISDIVTNLKDYAGQRNLAVMENFSINSAVADALMIASGLLKQLTDRFVVDMAADLPPVNGSRAAIEQVAVNLITNAVQSLPQKSCGLYISTSLDAGSKWVILEVRDEGGGMTEEVLSRIYDPFFTTRIDTGGTGLGLSIAQTIVNNHGGFLDIRSEPGKGTIARLGLPAVSVSDYGIDGTVA